VKKKEWEILNREGEDSNNKNSSIRMMKKKMKRRVKMKEKHPKKLI